MNAEGGGQRKPAVFLDRDGVLNEVEVVDGVPRPPAGVPDVRVIASAIEACRQLRLAGYTLVVVTNQPDVARGMSTLESVDAINSALGQQLGLDHFVVCPHDDSDRCSCRKPKPGMIIDSAARLGLEPRRSFMVGDRWRDIEAGRAAGCATIFVDRGYPERQPESPDLVVGELAQAVPWLIAALAEKKEGTKPHA